MLMYKQLPFVWVKKTELHTSHLRAVIINLICSISSSANMAHSSQFTSPLCKTPLLISVGMIKKQIYSVFMYIHLDFSF